MSPFAYTLTIEEQYLVNVEGRRASDCNGRYVYIGPTKHGLTNACIEQIVQRKEAAIFKEWRQQRNTSTYY